MKLFYNIINRNLFYKFYNIFRKITFLIYKNLNHNKCSVLKFLYNISKVHYNFKN